MLFWSVQEIGTAVDYHSLAVQIIGFTGLNHINNSEYDARNFHIYGYGCGFIKHYTIFGDEHLY